MEREARKAHEARAIVNKRLARQSNIAHAEGFVHTSNGKRYFKNGQGQPRGGERGKR